MKIIRHLIRSTLEYLVRTENEVSKPYGIRAEIDAPQIENSGTVRALITNTTDNNIIIEFRDYHRDRSSVFICHESEDFGEKFLKSYTMFNAGLV